MSTFQGPSYENNQGQPMGHPSYNEQMGITSNTDPKHMNMGSQFGNTAQNNYIGKNSRPHSHNRMTNQQNDASKMDQNSFDRSKNQINEMNQQHRSRQMNNNSINGLSN